MNPFTALQTVIESSKKHPWLLVLILLGIAAHWADMNWAGYHLDYLSKSFYGIALLYAGGSSVAIPQKPVDQEQKPSEIAPTAPKQ